MVIELIDKGITIKYLNNFLLKKEELRIWNTKNLQSIMIYYIQKKDYNKEVDFLLEFIGKNAKIIDMGCGTGIHASIIQNKGYTIDGLDLNKEMLDIAKTRVIGNLFLQDILKINLSEKYDVIISMFAVINHLKNNEELQKCFKNMKSILDKNGIIIIDLHNPQNSGQKVDKFDNITRIMKWDYDDINMVERSKIIFKINDKEYVDNHIFKIFSIKDIEECAKAVGLKLIKVFENYNVGKVGKEKSKNLQFLIKKDE